MTSMNQSLPPSISQRNPTLDFHRTAFDAVPAPVFVVMPDHSILDFNDAAISLPETVLRATIRPCAAAGSIGEALHCVNASELCGSSSACRDCQISRSIQEATAGRTFRAHLSLSVNRAGQNEILDFRLTAGPLRLHEEPLAVLMIEDEALWQEPEQHTTATT